MNKAQRLVKNIAINFLTQGLTFLISFVTTPIIFRRLGEEKFGLLMLFVSILGWFVLTDFGVVTAFIKYLAEKDEKKKANDVFQTASSLMFLMTPFFGLVVFLLAPFLIKNVFQVSPSLEPLAINSLKVMSLSFIFSLLGNFMVGVPRAKQRFEIANFKPIFLGIILPLGSISLLFLGFGFQAIIWLYVAANILVFLLFSLIAKRMLPGLKFKFKIKKQVVKKLFSFAGFKFLSQVSAKISFSLNHFVIAAFLSVSQLSYYAVPAGIGEKILSVLPNLTLPIFPLSSELEKSQDKEKIKRLYQEAVRLSNLLMTPVFCFLTFFGPWFLSVWMGEAFARQAGPLLQILSIAYLLASYPAVPATIIEGSGRPDLSAVGGGTVMGLMIVFSLFLIPRYGLLGAALAMLISRLIQVPLFVYWVSSRIVKIKKLGFYWNNYIKILLIGIISLLPLIRFAYLINNLYILFLFAFIYVTVFGLLSILWGVVGKKDLKVIGFTDA
jgi:O-antigen/teichoic acid export membrane protein